MYELKTNLTKFRTHIEGLWFGYRTNDCLAEVKEEIEQWVFLQKEQEKKLKN